MIIFELKNIVLFSILVCDIIHTQEVKSSFPHVLNLFQIFGNIYAQALCIAYLVFFYIDFDTPSNGGRGVGYVISLLSSPFGSIFLVFP